ncbi:hypothetical protein L2E82_15100 [Cichorium intybus]|uniref:Uncharacterized protein n=1 Tax=Cichorium intybus TaxID=13427 RepID=A0ACB9F284_CICIN|nr:hypothetical protein L2E82_15100 [Cichorium intybus]
MDLRPLRRWLSIDGSNVELRLCNASLILHIAGDGESVRDWRRKYDDTYRRVKLMCGWSGLMKVRRAFFASVWKEPDWCTTTGTLKYALDLANNLCLRKDMIKQLMP